MSADTLPSPADIFAPELPDVPYPGLRPFEKHEWPLFFGRERATQEVVDLLLQRGLVVVHGSSGCGKSSLIRAGVLSRLEQEHARSGLAWRTCAMRPGNAPTHNLARELACLGGTQTDAERVRKLRHLIARGPKAISALAKAVAAGPKRRVCLLVDQFEELFRFARETSREQATLLVGFLVGLAEARPSGLYAIATMRSEFLGHCAQFTGLAEAFNRSQYLLPPMERTALLQAIREPAALYGGEVARPLAERLVADAAGAQDTLPLIQHGLMRLWRQATESGPAPAPPEPWPHLDLAAYEHAGNLANLLSGHADSVLAEAAPDERRRKIAEHAFLALTDIDAEGNVTRRPRCFTELRTISKAPADELQAVLVPFRASEASFLIPGGSGAIAENETVDISHEALIREWAQLKAWTKANHDALRRREHIKDRMRQWEEQGRDKTLLLPSGLPLEEGKKLLADADHDGVLIEDVQPYIAASLKRDRQRRAIRRMLVLGIMAVLVAANGLAVWQWIEAQQQRNRAERNLALAQNMAKGLVFDLAYGFRDVTGVSNETIRKILGRADDLLASLVSGDAVSSSMLHTQMGTLIGFVDTYMNQGDLGAAEEAAAQAQELARHLVAIEPDATEAQRDLAVSWSKLGDVRQAQGDLAGALQAYEEDMKITAGLAAADPGNAAWQYDLGISHERLGDVLKSQDDLAEAAANYQRKHEIISKLAAADPGNAAWQRDLAVSWSKLGDVRQARGDLPGALEAYEKYHAIAERLAADDPGNAAWQYDLGISHERLGDVLKSQDDLAEAAANYQRKHEIISKLAAVDPGNAAWQRDLAVSWSKLGDVRQARGDLPGALEAYEKYHAIAERLAADDPGNAAWQRDLAVSWSKLGDVRRAQGDLAGASQAYEEDMKITAGLAAADPDNAAWQRDLAVSWSNLGDVRRAQGDLAGASQAYETSQEITAGLAAADPGNTE